MGGAEFSLSSESIDTQRLGTELADEASGALVVFEGRVRNSNEGRPVTGLDYEAYETLALSEGAAIVAQARERFPILRARCVHRVGSLEIGEVAVWVGVIAGHRGEAFDACRYIIDEVKERVPIWKKEHYADGDSIWLEGEADEQSSRR